MKFPNDEGSQFPRFHFPCNKEERVVLNYFFNFVLFISLKQLVNGVQFFSIVCLSFLSGSLTASVAPTPTSYGFFNKYTYMTLIT